jgi:hypothetical protein
MTTRIALADPEIGRSSTKSMDMISQAAVGTGKG